MTTILVKKTAVWSSLKTAKRLHLDGVVKSLRKIYANTNGKLIECRRDEIQGLVDQIDPLMMSSVGQKFHLFFRLYRTLRRMSIGESI